LEFEIGSKQAAIGMRMEKVVPWPGRPSTAMGASWASRMRFTMARPRPVPPCWRVEEDEIGRLRGHGGEGFLPVTREEDLVAFSLQVNLEQLLDLGRVIHHEDPRRGGTSRRLRRLLLHLQHLARTASPVCPGFREANGRGVAEVVAMFRASDHGERGSA
jgi:hypothetical protein